MCATAAAAAAGAVHRFGSCIHTGCRVDDGHGRACHTLVLGFKGGGSHPTKRKRPKKTAAEKRKTCCFPGVVVGQLEAPFYGLWILSSDPEKRRAAHSSLAKTYTSIRQRAARPGDHTHTTRAHTHTHTTRTQTESLNTANPLPHHNIMMHGHSRCSKIE